MPRTNLIKNPSFELDLTGWSRAIRNGVTAGNLVRGSGGTTGSYFAGFNLAPDGNSTATTADVAVTAPQAAVSPGNTYTIQFSANSSVSNQRCFVSYRYVNSAGSTLSSGTVGATSILTTTYAAYRRDAPAAPSGAVGLIFVFNFSAESGSTGGLRAFRIDAVIVETTSTFNGYFDGDTAGAAWNGTPHASTSTLNDIELHVGSATAALGLSAFASGLRIASGAGTACHGLWIAGAGSKSTQSLAWARAGLSARGGGPKIGIGTGVSPATGIHTRGSGPKTGVGTGHWTVGVGGFAVPPPPVPQFTGRPLPEDPLPLSQSRYLVQNILTGAWLHTDLPLSDDQVTLTLSGPCEISGKVAPEHADLKAPDGSPLLRSWGHVVYLEIDGDIRAAGLITEDSYDEQTQMLTCQGLSAYPELTPYQGSYRRYFADPMTVVSQMWDYVQSFTNADLGVVIERTSGTPAVLYGAKINLVPGDNIAGVLIAPTDSNSTDDDQPIVPVRQSKTVAAVFSRLKTMGFKNRAKIDPSKEATGTNVPPADCIFVTKAGLEQAYSDYFMSSAATRTLPNPPDVTSSFTIEPFKVDWWDVKTCGSIISDAVKALPADYVERYAWNYPHSGVDQKVLVGYPRLGRRRDDLRFVQGENIVSPPALEADPDSYATAVIGIGAGEGSASLRSVAEVVIPGRVRKTYVYRNSQINDRTTLARIVQAQLAQRQLGGYEVTSVIVRASHVNAPFGAYNVGDDVLTQTLVPHFGWFRQWGRITSMTLARGSDLVELHLKRSDSFFYGREVPST